jgi:hypothetical protein
MTVTISNKFFQGLKKSQTIEFVTKAAPYGGTVSIDPLVGVIGETEFTVELFNWESDDKPIKYQVWTAQDAGGEIQSKHLTSVWVD